MTNAFKVYFKRIFFKHSHIVKTCFYVVIAVFFFGLWHTSNMLSLKRIIFILLVNSVLGEDEAPSRRTCRQSLVAGLKAIFEENSNESCVSLLVPKMDELFHF